METCIPSAEYGGHVEDVDDDAVLIQKLLMDSARAACPRCRQGFCADHGTKLSATNKRAPWAAVTQLQDEDEGGEGTQGNLGTEETQTEQSALSGSGLDPEVVEQICKNKGCGKKFLERENHSTACHYHRGPISFSDRSTGEHKWNCCEVSVSNFEDLAFTPPCTRGKHYAPQY